MTTPKYCCTTFLRCHAATLALLAALVVQTAQGEALNGKHHFDIPAQPLNQALLNFGLQSHQQLIYNTDIAANQRSRPLKGDYSAAEAIHILLGNLPLHAVTTGEGTLTLRPKPGTNPLVPVANPKPTEPLSDDTTLPKVTVEADADPTWQTDPYNTDYVLPKATAGTKTNTPVMETPLNVQVISKQVLKDQQVISLDKALRNVSGVTTTTASGGRFSGNPSAFPGAFFLRGFETSALFRNGFRMDGNTFGNNQQFANVESVEVLKGPAAILYGRVEPGGMVNIVTKQPRVTPYYSLNQQFGSYDLYRTSIDATGPLTKDDTLLYRVNASFQSNNSFRDLVTGENEFFAPLLKWNISPRTQATLEMEYNHSYSSLDQQLVPFDETNMQVVDIPHSRNYAERNLGETDNIFVGLNWTHQFNDDWSIKHQVAFKRQDFKTNSFVTPFTILPDNRMDRFVTRGNDTNDTVATNLDLIGHFKTWELEHTLLFGGDYYRFNSSFDQGFSTSSISVDPPVHPGTPVIFDGSHSFGNLITDNYGLYLQDQIKLPYNVHVMGGLRYQYVHSTSGTGDASGFIPNPTQTDDAATPRVGILWQPKKWLSLYGNYAENFGANTGNFGFVDNGTKAGGQKPLPAQSAQQWEVGAKAELFDGRLRATLAYYELTKQNVATLDTAHRTSPFCAGNGCYVAAGEVRSRGPELDIQGEILPGWNVIATYANQDVRITKSKDTADTNGELIEGNRLAFTPRNIASFWSTYEVQQGALKGFKIGGGVNMQDGVVDTSNKIKSTGYALVGLSAGYSFEVGKSKITTQLNIDNLLDKSYFTNVSTFGTSVAYGTFSIPRTFMGSINVEY